MTSCRARRSPAPSRSSRSTTLFRPCRKVTVHNPENQSYLIAYKDSQLIVSSANQPLPHQNITNHVGRAVEDGMRAVPGVLLSLTNDNVIFKNHLYQLFLERERAAQLAESKTDELIRDAPTTQHDESGERQERSGEMRRASTEKTDGTEEKQKEEDDEELDLNTALQHAGKHVENCIVASYTALLLECLCQESPAMGTERVQRSQRKYSCPALMGVGAEG
uniref:Wings apart-like protein homolog n=1 Tax=Camelus bactrianus TaxID=9837 RepID=A0A9W3GHL3_CAMBA|nr:wings apart-like protein homolog [Camelus bactrianus]